MTAFARLSLAILCVTLISFTLASAVDCPESCSCMLPSEAKLQGYDPCSGKLTLCGYDRYQTAKYCYATFRAVPTGGTTSSAIPFGWFTYHAVGRAQTNEGTWITVDSVFRYDISSETFNGKQATRIKMDMRSTAATIGSTHVAVDMYTDPVSNAVLGGTATATGGGKTQTVNLAEIADLTQSNSGMTYTRPNDLRSSDIRDSMQMVARETGGRFTTSNEPVTMPAGTFPSATRYSVSIPDDRGTSTMSIWTSPDIPVMLKLQGKDASGTEIMKMELTGYGIAGSATPGGLLGGILSGDGDSPWNPFGGDLSAGDVPDIEDPEDVPALLMQSIGSGLGELGDGINSVLPVPVNWGGVPAAMTASVTPAALGAFGALVGVSLGTITLFPNAFSWTDSEQGEGGEGEIPDYETMVTAPEVVEQAEMTSLELAAAGIASDMPVDRLGAPPIDETDQVETGSFTETAGSEDSGTIQPAESAEIGSGETVDLEEQVTRLEQLQDLRSTVDQIIIQRQNEGYFIRNPNFPVKIWRWTVGGLYNWVAGNTGGQCGEAASWGSTWLPDDVKKIFGNDTLVEELVINPASYSNHAANQIVLPNGDRYIVDMWAGMHEGSSRIYTEDEWLEKWKKTIGGNPPVLRNNYEIQLEDTIRKYGNVKDGIDTFLHEYKDSEAAKITVRSYTKNPWFIP